jgi:hypothetical protein
MFIQTFMEDFQWSLVHWDKEVADDVAKYLWNGSGIIQTSLSMNLMKDLHDLVMKFR